MKRNLFTYLIVATSVLFLDACRRESETYTTNFNAQYSNGKNIQVIRRDSFTHFIGIYTGKDYGENHTFRYSFLLNPDDCKWTGTDRQVPQKILFNNEDIYLKVLGEKIKLDSADVNATPQVVGTFLYFKNQDGRYLFKMFGEQSFVLIDSIDYQNKLTGGREEIIPCQ